MLIKIKKYFNINKKQIIFYVFLSIFFIQPVQAIGSIDPASSITLCSQTKPCPTDHYCDVTCKGKKELNSFCKSANECLSNKCEENYCVDSTPKPTAGTTETKKPYEAVAPKLQIDIPTIQPFTVAGIKKDEAGNVELPFVGQYISGLYLWVLSIAGLVCATLIIIGGFIYVTSGGSADTITKAKEQITHALLGLGLLLLSYTILFLINPSLVKFENLKLKIIERYELESLSAADYSSITGSNKLPKGEILKKSIQASKDAGLDSPCYLAAIIGTESGGDPGIIGHDEINGKIGRAAFFASGKKYSGATFTPGDTSVRNDDGGKSSVGRTAPDYGLDWRFSHGLGLGQITLFGTKNYYCNGQRGITLNNHCFNIPELFTTEGGLLSMASLFKLNLAAAKKKGWTGEDIARAAFWGYAAGNSKIPSSDYGHGNLLANLPNGKLKPGGTKWGPYLACKQAGLPQSFVPANPEGTSTEIQQVQTVSTPMCCFYTDGTKNNITNASQCLIGSPKPFSNPFPVVTVQYSSIGACK